MKSSMKTWLNLLAACSLAVTMVACDDGTDEGNGADSGGMTGGNGGTPMGGTPMGGEPMGGEPMGGEGGMPMGGEPMGGEGGMGGEPMPDMEVPDATLEQVLCTRYCDTIQEACSGANSQFETAEGCMEVCMGYSFDGEEADVTGDTVQCRIYHAEVASEIDPFFHCPHAGPSGGGVCVDDPAPLCDTYCGLMIENCQGTYENLDECVTECQQIPDDGAIGDQMGDTVQCRLLYASQAAAMPETSEQSCDIAGPLGGGVCGLPTGQIDRSGRPAINTALIGAEDKDNYNKADPADAGQFIDQMVAALAFVDGLDGNDMNGLFFDDRATLAGLLAADVLLIDIAQDNCSGGYLALELGIENNCGGRTLGQDVMDVTLQALVDFTGTTTVTDAVDGNDKAFPGAFPYLPAVDAAE